MTAILPSARIAIAGNAPPSREWYRFFQDSLQVNLDVAGLREDVDGLSVRVTTLEKAPSGGSSTKITGYGSIYVSTTAIKTVTLTGDAEDPGLTTYYGTDPTGEKGWYPVADTLAGSTNILKTTDAIGVTSFDLADVTLTTGGTLKLRTFDAKGRLSQEDDATTTDLVEGTNLYFTDARADARITAQKGVANGIAPLGGDTKINVVYLPAAVLGQVSYQGMWDASAGTPPTTTPDKGWYYIVTVAGSTDLDGITDWKVGDWAIYNGSSWDKVDNTDAISTWNGRTGAVVPLSGDYSKADVGLGNVDNTSDADKPVSTAQAAAIALKFDKSGGEIDGQVNLNLTGGTPSGMLTGLQGLYIATSGAPGFIHLDGYANGGTGMLFRAANGTIASPAALGTGQFMGQFQARGWDGTAWSNESAAVGFKTTGAWSGTANGSRIVFRTTKLGTVGAADRWVVQDDGMFSPGADNVYDMGTPALRGRTAYFGTGTINTSDAREKTAVAPLTAAEIAAASDLSREVGTYQWLAMVAEKGSDGARHHAGLTVQRAIEIMQAHGLDPMRYGFICYDQWGELPEVVNSWPAQDAVLDDDGNVVTPAVEAGSEITQEYRAAGDRYSFRTDELLLFIARGVDARLSVIEAKLP